MIKPGMLARTMGMTSIRAALIQSIHSMTEEQAHQLVLALGQWADNQRNFVDDAEPEEVSASDRAQLEAAEAVVEAGEGALIAAVESLSALPSPEVWVHL